jgi:hypothetical protein
MANMPIMRKITGLLTILFLCASLSAFGQSVQQDAKKQPAASGTSSVHSSRPARVRLGGFVFGAGYSWFGGGFPYYPLYPHWYHQPWYPDVFYPHAFGYYAPVWYHSGWYTGFAHQPGMGEIKLRSNLEDADVFLNDGFAGKAKELKSIWLEPGAYNLRVEAGNHAPFAARIYVLSGKTLKIDAKLIAQ